MVRPVYSKKHRSRRPNKRTRRVKKRRGQCGGVNELVECPICLEYFNKSEMFSFHNYSIEMGNRHCICAGCMVELLKPNDDPDHEILCPLCRVPYTKSYTCNIPWSGVVSRGFARLIPVRRPATTGQYPTYATVAILLWVSPRILYEILVSYMSEFNSSASIMAYAGIVMLITVFYPNVYNNLIYWIESKLGIAAPENAAPEEPGRGGGRWGKSKTGKSKTGKSKTGKSRRGGASDVMPMATLPTSKLQEKTDSTEGYNFLSLSADKLKYLYEYILKNQEEFDKVIAENNSTEPLYMLLEFPDLEYTSENIKKYSELVELLNAQILEKSQNK